MKQQAEAMAKEDKATMQIDALLCKHSLCDEAVLLILNHMIEEYKTQIKKWKEEIVAEESTELEVLEKTAFEKLKIAAPSICNRSFVNPIPITRPWHLFATVLSFPPFTLNVLSGASHALTPVLPILGPFMDLMVSTRFLLPFLPLFCPPCVWTTHWSLGSRSLFGLPSSGDAWDGLSWAPVSLRDLHFLIAVPGAPERVLMMVGPSSRCLPPLSGVFSPPPAPTPFTGALPPPPPSPVSPPFSGVLAPVPWALVFARHNWLHRLSPAGGPTTIILIFGLPSDRGGPLCWFTNIVWVHVPSG
ncbi:unnamed protein product [Calypogeia fissa]